MNSASRTIPSMTPDEFVTAWMNLLDSGAEVRFHDDMKLYVCTISVHNEKTDEYDNFVASGNINIPNPVALFAEAYSDMKAGLTEEEKWEIT